MVIGKMRSGDEIGLTYEEMEVALSRYFDTRKHLMVPNYYINFGTAKDHECDLIVVRPSGYAFEIEIKTSRSDMRADLAKKHGHVSNRLKSLYYAFPEDVYHQCKDLVPDGAGIITIAKFVYDYGQRDVVSVLRVAKDKPCRRLTEKEMFHVAKMGVMKLWQAKANRVSTNIKISYHDKS